VTGAHERARLFVALELPAVVRTELAEWRSERVAGVSGLRLTASEALHLTLCFLGPRPVGEIDAVAEGCASVAAGRPRPVLELGEPVWLPRRRPRVLAIGLGDGPGELAALQSALAAALAQGGWYVPERRPFRPHVTVARAAGNARPQPLPLAAPHPITFVGSELVLMRSRTRPGGAEYERLSAVSLGDRSG
jgi:RNA 2',3'-cyclic 3'-phosphodiesterase